MCLLGYSTILGRRPRRGDSVQPRIKSTHVQTGRGKTQHSNHRDVKAAAEGALEMGQL